MQISTNVQSAMEAVMLAHSAATTKEASLVPASQDTAGMDSSVQVI